MVSVNCIFVSCESAGDKRLDFALEQAGKTG